MSKPIELREADFKREVWEQKYPDTLRQEFYEYWTEPNRSGTKMKYEMEKTWHLGRRMKRWANNGFGKTEGKAVIMEVTKTKDVITDFDRVDALLEKYKLHPTTVQFSEFGQWYELLKTEKLLAKFTTDQIESIREAYSNDNEKCRCACVQMTFDTYAKTALNFSEIINLRKRLA